MKIERRTRNDRIEEIARELGELMYAFDTYEVRDAFDDFDYDEYISTLASDLHDPKYRADMIDYIRDILEELEVDSLRLSINTYKGVVSKGFRLSR